MRLSFAVVSVLCLFSGSAMAAKLVPTSVAASSNYPDEGGISYAADRIGDGKVSTAWVEGDSGSGLGSWITADFGGEKSLQKVKVWGGLWYSSDYWKRANRPKQIEFEYSDGSKDTFELKNEMKPQEFVLSSPRKTSSVKIKVRAVHDGTTWLDTAISEVQFFDASPDTQAAVRAITSSSTLPADADGNYDPLNTSDGINDSMWCEGNKAGDGTGEWLEFQLASTQSVSKLTLINGIATSMPFWMKANRATQATLAFSDGSSEVVAVKNSMMSQTISFPAHSTSKVKVTFSGVAKGKEFNDLCISEASFSE